MPIEAWYFFTAVVTVHTLHTLGLLSSFSTLQQLLYSHLVISDLNIRPQIQFDAETLKLLPSRLNQIPSQDRPHVDGLGTRLSAGVKAAVVHVFQKLKMRWHHPKIFSAILITLQKGCK